MLSLKMPKLVVEYGRKRLIRDINNSRRWVIEEKFVDNLGGVRWEEKVAWFEPKGCSISRSIEISNDDLTWLADALDHWVDKDLKANER